MTTATEAIAKAGLPVHGLVARFDTPEELLVATKKAYTAGYRRMDAYTPLPVDGLGEALGRKGTAMPLIMLLGGITGGVTGFFTCNGIRRWSITRSTSAGGRSIVGCRFIPITFEFTVLLSAISGVLGLFFLNGLPRYNHPIFNARGIERATVDRFFLCIESTDPKWDGGHARFLADELKSPDVTEVLA